MSDPTHLRRLILAWLCARGDGETVPGVDCCDGQSQVGQFLFAEVGADFFVNLVGDVAVGDAGHGFGPSESRAFAVRVMRRFALGVEPIKTLLAFSDGPQIFPVHVDAICAAVDL